MSELAPVVVSGTSVGAPLNQGADLDADASGATTDLDRPEKQRSCKDPIFAVLLYANIGAIGGVVAAYGQSFEDAIGGVGGEDYSGYAYSSLITGAFSMIASGLALNVMMCIPEILIKISLAFAVIMSGVYCALSFWYSNYLAGFIGAIYFALMICYAFAVRDRIPFATANLVTAITGVKANWGLFPMAYISVIVAFAWSLMWTVAFLAVVDRTTECVIKNGDGSCAMYGSPSYGYLFLLFLSYFFTNQVIQNVVHTTTAGVLATWWIVPEEAASCCSPAVKDSCCRSLTTSFGSICFGSMVVAIIQALRGLANAARNDDNGVLICLADCILGCLESLAEYLNKWAFVYVGIYGQTYLESGKSVMELFVNRGWDAVIADDLVSMALFFVSVSVGLMSGAVGVIVALSNKAWFSVAGEYANTAAFILGFMIGLMLTSIMMSILGSAVNAIIVLFAESPAEFQENHPELSERMRETWDAAFPGCL